MIVFWIGFLTGHLYFQSLREIKSACLAISLYSLLSIILANLGVIRYVSKDDLRKCLHSKSKAVLAFGVLTPATAIAICVAPVFI